MTEIILLLPGGKWDRIVGITWSQKTHAIEVCVCGGVDVYQKVLGSKMYIDCGCRFDFQSEKVWSNHQLLCLIFCVSGEDIQEEQTLSIQQLC